MREFIRDMNIRYERSFLIVATELKEMGDQIRANTAATWAIVDEIRGAFAETSCGPGRGSAAWSLAVRGEQHRDEDDRGASQSP